METHPPTPWKCPANEDHILGQVVRRNGIRRLDLFRNAVRPGEQGEIIATLTGTADNIVCSICGRERNWFAPEEGMRELLAKTGRKANTINM